MKKILSTLSSTLQGGARGGLLILALIASSSLWAYDFQSGDLYYNITSNTTVEVTSQNSWGDDNYAGLTTATIPETVTYNATTYSVTSIGEGAFASCSSLTSITIPNSVTSIGDYEAFYGCSSLTSVVWNAKHCADFTSAPFGNQTTTLVFGDSVEHIPAYLGYGMYKLTSITIPESVTSIGYRAFSGCSSLTSVTIPNSVTSIGERAFEACSSLTSIVWNAKHCADFTSAPFGNQTTSLVFGDSVEHIPAYLGYGMNKLTSITIPNSVTSIGGNAFEGCSSLTKTNYTGDVAGWCEIKFGGSNANPMYYSHNFYINDQEIKDLVIPNTVDSIHNYAFYNCSSLTSITIPNSVTSIGDVAFYGIKLTSYICYSPSLTSFGMFLSEQPLLDTIVAPAAFFDVEEAGWASAPKHNPRDWGQWLCPLCKTQKDACKSHYASYYLFQNI